MSTPWAGWDEWEEVYALLFAMDDSSARMSGVQHVNVWRLRGNTLPLSVDATATFVELGLLDHAPTPLSEHAQGLMYAMAITRLVNGIVDPMQQASRALSVKRLAQSVGMPMVLVELRHECTHNRMPSLDRLRAAADEALLWLHGHYWLPQRALRVECSDSIHGCLRTYQQAAESRLADGEQPLRKDVVACALGLEKAVAPAQLATHLVAALFDHGYLAPPPTSSASAPLTGRSEGTKGSGDGDEQAPGVRAGRGSRSSRGGGGRGAGGGGGGEGGGEGGGGGEEARVGGNSAPTGAADAADDAISPVNGVSDERNLLPEMVRSLWAPLLARLDKTWPAEGCSSALFLGAVQRLHAEAKSGPAPGVAGRGAARLLALYGWSMHLIWIGASEGSGGGGYNLDPRALTQGVWLATRTAHGWGRGLVLRATRHPAWPSVCLANDAKRLVSLQDAAVRVASAPVAPVAESSAATIESSDAGAASRRASGGGMADAGAAGAAANSSQDNEDGAARLVEAQATRLGQAATLLVPRVAPGSAWQLCARWAPTPLGAPPPSGVLSALYASAVIDEVAMNGTGDSQDGTDVAGAADAIENNNEGAAAAASALSAPAIPSDLPKDAASDQEAPPPPPLEVKLLYRRQAAPPPQASAPAKDERASGQKRGRQNSDTATPQARGETPSKQEAGGCGGSAVGAESGSTDGNEQAVAAAGTGRRKKRR